MPGGLPTRLRRISPAGAILLCVLAATAGGASAGNPGVASLEARDAALAAEHRSATLDLYALDTRLARAEAQLSALEAREQTLRTQRLTLATELELARRTERVSRQELAVRIRFLYDHGTTSALELFFGARSFETAVSELDDINRVSDVNDDVLHEVRGAEARYTRLARAFQGRQLSLDAELRQAAGVTAELERTQAARSAYIARLDSQRAINGATIDAIEAQAQAAAARARSLPAPTSTPFALASASPPVTAPLGGRTLVVSTTGYSLPGRTATGLPVGWGVVAVDPSVIPLGTHLTIPGYGEAVAADTGSAVVGDSIDLWFPTLAQAEQWGRRSITVSLH